MIFGNEVCSFINYLIGPFLKKSTNQKLRRRPAERPDKTFFSEIARKFYFLDLIKIQTVNSIFDVYFNAEKIEVPLWATFV